MLQGDLAQGLVPEQEQTISFDDSKSMYDALANGQLDALVDNVISANFLALSRYSGAIKLAFAANNIPTRWPSACAAINLFCWQSSIRT